MWNMNDVINIKFIKPYSYFVEFDDGTKGEVDFGPLLNRGPIFLPLKKISLFRSAVIDGGTIAWPNGADIAPETLYESIQESPNNSFKPTRARAARTA